MKTKILAITVSAAVAAALLYFLAGHHMACSEKRREEKIRLEERRAEWNTLARRVGSEARSFKGRSGIVIKDLRTGWEMHHNREMLFPSASLVKIPVMAACFGASEEGRIKLDQEVALKSSDKLTGSGALKGMRSGSLFTVRDLIGFMIYDSDNTAANMLTGLLGLDYLNDAFRSFGLKQTGLSRRIADYKMRDRGIENYTTAADMADILGSMYRGDLVSARASGECIDILKMTKERSRIPKYMPDGVETAHKTGLERGVCHDAGIIFAPKGDILVVALTKHGNRTASLSKEFIARVAFLAYCYTERAPDTGGD